MAVFPSWPDLGPKNVQLVVDPNNPFHLPNEILGDLLQVVTGHAAPERENAVAALAGDPVQFAVRRAAQRAAGRVSDRLKR